MMRLAAAMLYWHDPDGRRRHKGFAGMLPGPAWRAGPGPSAMLRCLPGNERSSRFFSVMVTASSRPACSTVRHCGQRLPWSMAREKQGLQKEWPQGVVTARCGVQGGRLKQGSWWARLAGVLCGEQGIRPLGAYVRLRLWLWAGDGSRAARGCMHPSHPEPRGTHPARTSAACTAHTRCRRSAAASCGRRGARSRPGACLSAWVYLLQRRRLPCYGKRAGSGPATL